MNDIRLASTGRLIATLVLGFSSGLPLALSGTALQTWLTISGVDIGTIGFFALVGLPYTFKFLWAPLMDRLDLPLLGRRRGWIVLTQLLVCCLLLIMSTVNPNVDTKLLAIIGILLAFASASQDVVIDAYRTDILDQTERGLGSSLSVLGYRMAMILSGGIALIWADQATGGGKTWPEIYIMMSKIMGLLAVYSLLALPKLNQTLKAHTSPLINDLKGLVALSLLVACSYMISQKLLSPAIQSLFEAQVTASTPSDQVQNLKKWGDVITLILSVLWTLPAGVWVANATKFDTLNRSLKNFFSQKAAWSILCFIILYKLGDAFAGSLTSPFLIKGVGFSQAEIGVINKVIGLWLTVAGALIGGAVMMKLSLFRSLMVFGILQLISNIGFYALATFGKGYWGSFLLPAFDIVVVSIKEPTSIDFLLLLVIGFENLSGGMGTAAFVTLLMALCNQKFTATQYALLSAFASVGRVWVGPVAGVFATSFGWPTFFLASLFFAIPGLLLLQGLKPFILDLTSQKIASNELDD